MKYLLATAFFFIYTKYNLTAQTNFINKEFNATIGLVTNFPDHGFLNMEQNRWNAREIEFNISAGLEYLIKAHDNFKIGPTIEIQNFKQKMYLVENRNVDYYQHAIQVRAGFTFLYNVKKLFEIYGNLAWLYVDNYSYSSSKITHYNDISYVNASQSNLNSNLLSINIGLRKAIIYNERNYGNISTIFGVSNNEESGYTFEYFINNKPFYGYNYFDALRFSIQYSYNLLPKKVKYKVKKRKSFKQHSRLNCPTF